VDELTSGRAKLRILFVITCLGIGGAEKVVAGLADGFADAGHEVIIAYLNGEALVKPRNTAVRLVGLDLNGVKDLARASLRLRSLVRDFQPDVVHSHLIHANILCRLLRLCAPIPRLITSAHNRDEEGCFRMLAYRLTNRLSNVFTNVSGEAVAAFVQQGAAPAGQMKVVHNGVSTRDFHCLDAERRRIRGEYGVGPGTNLIVAVGRLDEAKDYPNLFAALVRLGADAPAYKLLVAGDGPLRGELAELIARFRLDDRVRLLGVRRDVPALLSASDLFVLSSVREGFPMVIGEAMSAGCMVVATDCGGVSEFLGETGLLVPAANPEALAQALRTALLLSNSERRQYGLAAQRRVQELYSLEVALKKWLALYRDDQMPVSQRAN
jgi:glycosyltransferase involved in cell wall biosynthesis